MPHTRSLATVGAVLALALSSPAAAQFGDGSPLWYGSACAADGSACAEVNGYSGGASGIAWSASITFYRPGLFHISSAWIAPIGDTTDELLGVYDLFSGACCAAPGGTLTPFGSPLGSIGSSDPTPGGAYAFPIGAYVVPVGDPRTAQDLADVLTEAWGTPTPQGDMRWFGLELAIGAVVVTEVPEAAPQQRFAPLPFVPTGRVDESYLVPVTATPEPATLALVGAGAALLALRGRRRVIRRPLRRHAR